MKYLLIVSSLIILLFSCTKHKIKNKCCERGTEITPAGYNADSVAIWAPQLITANGDGLNDHFFIAGIGWTMKSMEITKGRTTVFETSSSTGKWDGSNKGKIKDGHYQFKVEIKTIHGETLEVKGDICVFSYSCKKLIAAEEDAYCDCSTGDMIDPEYGFIYGKGEPCN